MLLLQRIWVVWNCMAWWFTTCTHTQGEAHLFPNTVHVALTKFPPMKEVWDCFSLNLCVCACACVFVFVGIQINKRWIEGTSLLFIKSDSLIYDTLRSSKPMSLKMMCFYGTKFCNQKCKTHWLVFILIWGCALICQCIYYYIMLIVFWLLLLFLDDGWMIVHVYVYVYGVMYAWRVFVWNILVFDMIVERTQWLHFPFAHFLIENHHLKFAQKRKKIYSAHSTQVIIHSELCICGISSSNRLFAQK